MKLEAVSQRIRYFLPGGGEVVLLPGVPVELPAAAVLDLLKKAPTAVRPASPIKIGWLIGHEVQGRLRGGPDDREYGEVVDAQFTGGEWRFTTKNHCVVKGSQVRGVTRTDAHGTPIACWTTREHGLAGEKSSRRLLLHELPRDQRQKIQDAFALSDDTVRALCTGTWSDAVWDAFWKGRP